VVGTGKVEWWVGGRIGDPSEQTLIVYLEFGRSPSRVYSRYLESCLRSCSSLVALVGGAGTNDGGISSLAASTSTSVPNITPLRLEKIIKRVDNGGSW
jgi:hypothetical protein